VELGRSVDRNVGISMLAGKGSIADRSIEIAERASAG
jgi:hypothetical protein